MTEARRFGVLVAAALAAASAARAEDGDLPKGAVARLAVPPRAVEVLEDDLRPVPEVGAVAMSEHGDRVVAAVIEGRLLAWEVGAATPRELPARHQGDVNGIAWSPVQDDAFATCSTGSDVRLWSFAAGATLPLAVGRTHGSGRGPAFSPDGRWLLVGAPWGAFVWWEIGTGRRLVTSGIDGDIDKEGIDYGIAWSPDGAQVAIGDAKGALVLRQVAGGAAFRVPNRFDGPIRGVGYAPDQTALVVLAGSTLHSFSAPELGVPPKSARREGRFTCAAHSPTARLVAAGDADGRLLLLDGETLADAAVAKGHTAAIASLAFSGDGRRVVTGDSGGVVLVWDVASLLGREPERVERAPLSGAVPSPPRPRAFPPHELRPGRADGLADGERIEPYAATLPGVEIGDDDVRAVLVIDGTTGLPLPGATVVQCAEEVGAPPGAAYATSTTDGNGIAFAVWEPGRNFGHWLVAREGFSPCHVFRWESLPRTVVLQPRPDAVGRIVDAYGKPVGGAEVDFFSGCGHSPSLARATTGGDGLFRLRASAGRGGQLVVHAPGVSAEYLDANVLGALGDEPVTYVLRPGADVRGRVVDADGWGVAGISVKAGTERSVTRTQPDGTFLLRGVATDDTIEVTGPMDVGKLLSVGGSGVDWARPDLSLVMTIPLEGDEPEFAAGPGVQFDVLLLDRDSGALVPAGEAVLVSRTTGIRYFPEVVEEGEPSAGALRFKAPEGGYLLVPGTPFASHAAEPIEVRVARGQEVPLIVRAARQPCLALRFEGDPPRGAEIEVVAAGSVQELEHVSARNLGGRRGVTLVSRRMGDVHLPAAGPAAVVVRLDAMQRAYPLGPESDGVREVVIAWPKPRRIRVSGLVGKDFGVERGVQAEIVEEDADVGTCVVETDASGAVHFEIHDEGDGRAVVDVAVPDEPGATVEAQVRRVPRTTFMLRAVDGKPLAAEALHVTYARWTGANGTPDGEGDYPTDQAGIVVDAAAVTGSVVDFHPSGWAPRRVVVRRDGEQLVAWGDATLVVEVTDDSGKPLDAVLCVDGMLVDVAKGAVTLKGMDAGRRTILVAASNRQAQTLDVNLARGASRTIRVALPEEAK